MRAKGGSPLCSIRWSGPPDGPDVGLPGGPGGVLGHDPHQGVGDVGGLQVGPLLRGEGEVHRPGRPLHVGELRGPHHRGGDFSQQPGQGDLCHGHPPKPGHLRHPAEDLLDLLGGVVVLQPGVVVLPQALGGRPGVPGEPPAGQSAVGGHGDAVLGA